jgi:hypothetical protein
MSKERWKRLVKKQVKTFALRELNDALSRLKMGEKLDPYDKLQQQDYIQHLGPQQTRTIFQIRAGVIDLKCVRKYWYNDDTCRLCQQEKEDVEHVVNKCPELSRSHNIDELYKEDVDELREIAVRFSEFTTKLGELNQTPDI